MWHLWLWVTQPAHYLAEYGDDAPALDPATGSWPMAGGRHPRAQAGDLVLLYRAAISKDVSHFLVARSDAELLDNPTSEFHGADICQYEVQVPAPI